MTDNAAEKAIQAAKIANIEAASGANPTKERVMSIDLPPQKYTPSKAMKKFDFEKLKDYQQGIASIIKDAAESVDRNIPDGKEKDAALEALLKARNSVVKALDK